MEADVESSETQQQTLRQAGQAYFDSGALISMHTPAVLTFLHLLAALLMQLTLVSNNFIPPPHISIAAAKGALVPATLNTLQVLLLAGVLLHSSVYMVLCWVTVVPLLLELSRVADVSSKTAWRAIPQQQQLPLAAAVAGLVLELLADTHRGFVPLLLLLLWCGVLALQLLWQQIKVDATLGHRLMDPDFLFRARQLSDHEDALTPSTAAILGAALPAGPVLILGLICLEGKDLVDHEPSVPTLSVVLLSCLSYAGAVSIRTMLADSFAGCPELSNLLTAAAALLAIVLDFMERAHALGLWCLLGVVMAVSGCLAFQLMHWKSLGKPPQLSS
eukprot:gene10669-10828_t